MSNKPIMESEDLISRNPDLWEDVVAFHQKFKIDYDGPPRKLDTFMQKFREEFIVEEGNEFFLAGPSGQDNAANQLDACCDLIYVILGYCRLRGWNFPEAWRRVQRANMSKVRAIDHPEIPARHPNDVVKPPGWTPPNHEDLV